jgi:hypothetical protein
LRQAGFARVGLPGMHVAGPLRRAASGIPINDLPRGRGFAPFRPRGERQCAATRMKAVIRDGGPIRNRATSCIRDAGESPARGETTPGLGFSQQHLHQRPRCAPGL